MDFGFICLLLEIKRDVWAHIIQNFSVRIQFTVQKLDFKMASCFTKVILFSTTFVHLTNQYAFSFEVS